MAFLELSQDNIKKAESILGIKLLDEVKNPFAIPQENNNFQKGETNELGGNLKSLDLIKGQMLEIFVDNHNSLVKTLNSELELVTKSYKNDLKKANDEIGELRGLVEKIGSESQGRKSKIGGNQNGFIEKGSLSEELQTGKTILSISVDEYKVKQLLSKEAGFDENNKLVKGEKSDMLMDAMLRFDADKVISPAVIDYFNSKNIIFTK